jgi:hypothetical protein
MALLAPAVRAQGPSGEQAADALFLEAKALLRDGDAASACPKLAESQRLDPGTGTLLMLALCHERLGRTATAYTEYKDALTRAHAEQRADREELARRHIASLEERLAHLKIVVLEQELDPSRFEVRRDGAALGTASGTAVVPIDPGAHVVEVYAGRERVWSRAVNVGNDANEYEVVVPRLAAHGAPAPPSPVAPASAPEPRASHPLRAFAIGAGVVAVAGVALGAVFGARAVDQSNESKRLCPAYPCAAGAQAANDDARSAAVLSNVSFAIGGAGLVGAVSLFLLDRSAPSGPAYARGSAAAGPHVAGAGLGWRGEW